MFCLPLGHVGVVLVGVHERHHLLHGVGVCLLPVLLAADLLAAALSGPGLDNFVVLRLRFVLND